MPKRPPRTISQEDQDRSDGEQCQRWFNAHGISTAEVNMLTGVIRAVREFRPDVHTDGPIVRRHRIAGGLVANANTRDVVLSALLDRIDGRRIETYEVYEAKPDFAPGLIRGARMDRLFYAMLRVEALTDKETNA